MFTRISLGVLGLLLLLDAAWRKRPYRFGLYDFEDESDICLDRRTGKRFELVIGLAFILSAILSSGPE